MTGRLFSNRVRGLYLLLLVVTISKASVGQPNQLKPTTHGFVDFNGYFDTREFSVFTMNVLGNLPHGFQYFSLTNYQGVKNTTDLSNFYAEHNLRWAVADSLPLDVTYQLVLRNGDNDDDHRLGVRWQVSNTNRWKSSFKNLNLVYSINPMFVQFRTKSRVKYLSIIEHVYAVKILPNLVGKRVYLAGFADQNFVYREGKVALKWVSEHQLGCRIVDQFYLVAEYRINTFLPSERYGMGYGVEYKLLF